MKDKKLHIRILSSLSITVLLALSNVVFSQTVPPDMANMVLWLKADSGIVKFGASDSIQQWNDMAGTNDSARQATASAMPRRINGGPLMNYKPVVAFDGNNDVLTGPILAGLGAGQYSIFILANGNAQTGNASYGLFGMATGEGVLDIYRRAGTNQNITVLVSSGVLATTTGSFPSTGFPYRVLNFTQSTGTQGAKLYINGTLAASSTLSTFGDNIYTIGRANATLNGNIAEILVYPASLPDSTRTKVEMYLYNKYAPPVSLGIDTLHISGFCAYALNASNKYVSYQWNTGSTDSIINITHSGTYIVSATDVFGRVSKDTVVAILPNVNINAPSNILCAGNSMQLSTAYSSPQYLFDWNNGLSSNSTLQISTGGSYYVKVTDSNTSCFKYSDTVNIGFDNLSNDVSLGPDANLCSGNIIKLITPTNTQQLTFNWSPGGSTDSTYAVSTTGAYSVTVTNQNGCTGTDAINVTITGSAPIASFAGDTLCLGEVYLPGNASFTTDGSNIVSYAWTFGDGGTSLLATPTHTYTANGTYTVSLTITTSNSCNAVANRTVLVRALPMAGISNYPLGCLQAPVQFNSQSTPANGTSIVQWLWLFGDGQNAIAQHPQYTYASTGIYMPQLIVTDNFGCVDTAQSIISINNSAPAPSNVSYIQPSNGVVTNSTAINFLWNTGNNVMSYRLIIAEDSLFSTNTSSYNVGVNTNYALTLPANKKYFWKIRAYNVCNDSVDFSISKFTIFDPLLNVNARLWLSADSGIVKFGATDSVQYWNDLAGTNDTARQTTASNMPRLINAGPLMNNKPVLAFDGNNDVMTGRALTGIGAGQYTIFVLANGNNQSGNASYGLFGVATGEGVFDIYRRAGTNQNMVALSGGVVSTATGSFPNTGYPYRLISLTQSIGAGGAKMRSNDTLVGTSTLNAFGDDIYTIGRANATLNGNIAEVLVFTTALSDSIRTLVEKFLYDKYAPPVNLGPDVVSNYSLCPITVDAGPRFTKYLWSNGDTTRQVTVNSSEKLWVRAVDIFGRLSSDTLEVITPYKGLPFTDTLLCIGNSVVIQPVLTNVPYNLLWNIGGNTSSITVNQPGSYYVAIEDSFGCGFTSDTVTVQVDSFPSISLLPTDSATCIGNLLMIDNNGYGIASINWSNSTDTTFITVNAAGIYSVTATDTNQCSVSDTINITIKGVAPVVDFTATNVCFGNTSVFNDLSSTQAPDQLSNWIWDFGDTNNGSGQNVNHTYNSPGMYSVSLTVVTDSGCSASIVKNASVFGLPQAVITQLAPICAQNAGRISGVSVAPVGATISNWEWQVGGSIVSLDTFLRYPFPQQGIIPVTLAVTTSQGCSDTVTGDIEIYAPFVADFEVANVCVGDSSYFFDVTPSFSVISRVWNFGDATSVSGTKNPVKKYNSAGSYNVTLTVTNAIGCRDTSVKTVIAASKPIAKFGNLSSCEDAFYTPLDSSTSAQEPIDSWQWTIGGFNYNTQAPQRYFANPGPYPVKLVVRTPTGCTDSISKIAVVHPRPTANFSYVPLYGDAPLNVTFTNQSTSDSTYLWEFGDGDISTQKNPVHTYTENGNYDVKLTVASPYGCTVSRTKPYTVIQTDLDFAVNEANVQIAPLPDGSSLAEVSVIGSNIGTRIIDHIQFYVTLGGVGVIAEDWTGTLYTGAILADTFSAKFVVPQGKGDSYICVTAVSVNNGQEELRVDNNSQCFGITEGIKVMGPLPNPALHQSSLGLILPKHGKVTIDIANMMGQYIVKGIELDLPEGRSDYELPIGQMVAGEYFIRILYNDEKVVRKFIISR